MKYKTELIAAMTWLGEQKDTVFIGQAVGVGGTFMSQTLEGVPLEKRTEWPVCESFQMQASIGMALTGQTIISIFPRQNFLLLALADLINTLDKLPNISNQKLRPKVIIRTAKGPESPIYPGHQHVGHYAEAFQLMLDNIPVYELNNPSLIVPCYKAAYEWPGPVLMIEDGNLYEQN